MMCPWLAMSACGAPAGGRGSGSIPRMSSSFRLGLDVPKARGRGDHSWHGADGATEEFQRRAVAGPRRSDAWPVDPGPVA